jgi:hypothetical protein
MAKSTKIDEEELRKFVFNSELVEELTQKLNDGIVLKRYQNPWFKNEIGNRRAGITFAMTPEEIAEYIKCKTDIKYFAQKYCKIKVEDGSIKNLTLRDYQIDILELYQNRKSILCGSRQIGKCLSGLSQVFLENGIKKMIYQIYYEELKKIRPLTILEKIKLSLYNLISQFEGSQTF